MTLPDKFIEVIEMLPLEDAGQAYIAVINYMRRGDTPSEEISASAKAVFYALKIDIDRVMQRRRREAARRRRRRQEHGTDSRVAISEGNAEDNALKTESASNPDYQEALNNLKQILAEHLPQDSHLTRQQRRALERAQRKASSIHSGC